MNNYDEIERKIFLIKNYLEDNLSVAEEEELRVWLDESPKHRETFQRIRDKKILFQEQWNKYALGTQLTWEMDSLGFYSHGHELEGVDKKMYGIVAFEDLPEDGYRLFPSFVVYSGGALCSCFLRIMPGGMVVFQGSGVTASGIDIGRYFYGYHLSGI